MASICCSTARTPRQIAPSSATFWISKSIDAGEGWLIFALPPAELGIHPGDGKFIQHHADQKLLGSVVYLMCDDLRETIHSLTAKGVATAEIQEAGWGITTTVRLPSGEAWGSMSLATQPRFISPRVDARSVSPSCRESINHRLFPLAGAD
jgi:hypothetical protein